MKRKSIAIAVTGMLALPFLMANASAAGLTIYGKAHGSVDVNSNDDNDPNDSSTLAFTSDASRIGFKGKEDVGDGLTVTYQAETTLSLDNGGFGSGRNTYVGLANGFGEVRFGKHDTPYKMATNDMYSDTRGDYNAIIGSVDGDVLFDERNPNSILYLSPDMSGFQVMAAYTLGIGATDDDLPDAKDPKNTGYSLAALYNQGPLFLSVATESYDTSPTTGEPVDNASAVKLGAGWDLGQGTKLTFIYEDADSGTTDVTRTAYYLGAMHKLGEKTTLKAAIAQADDLDVVDNSGASFFVLGVSQKLSKDTELYALYSSVSNDDNASYSVDGVGFPEFGDAGPTISSFSFGIVKNFSADLM